MGTHDLCTAQQKLYAAQEYAYAKIMGVLAPFDVRLIGGTPLARCYLHHRISYDLDFSVNPECEYGFSLAKKVQELEGVTPLKITGGGPDAHVCAFMIFSHDDTEIEFSLCEDRKYLQYEHATQRMGQTEVNTVSLDTMYANKVRAVAGDLKGFHRQTLRDIFDLLVLSRTHRKLPDFLQELAIRDCDFIEDRFYENLANMPWHQFANDRIVPLGQWETLEDIATIREAIYAEVGMVEISD